MSDPLFKKVLVANRGEIACRIMQTLARMGIVSVAIHHAAESRARHVRMADESAEITGETPVAAHLDIEQIIGIAQRLEVDAIHPGYGFLSENAKFAAAVAKAGITFIGPDAETIALMGDKISARNFAEKNGIAVAPSVMPTDDLDTFIAQAASIGFPLLIKAAAGGGGKGMSIVRDPGQLAEAARVASSEAQRYFGDGRVYAETFVDRPRHIEVQVLGDGKGGAIHLFERECSIQRRFQKIIEEAPAANISPEIRAEICASATRLTAAANYKNAGTVEYILGSDGRFFFLEMNTRLQVEHPVTEMITGLDLVRVQIEIAAGGELPFRQEAVQANGHAIECRICAENPENDFTPETGVVRYLSVPEAEWLRFENAISSGQKITADFDPMLAKLVAHGPDRNAAIERSIAALSELSLLGVKTNIDYLARLIAHEAFGEAKLHTGFIAEHAKTLAPLELSETERAQVLAAAFLGFRQFRDLITNTPEPHAAIGGWRN